MEPTLRPSTPREIHIYSLQPITLETLGGEAKTAIYPSQILRYREGVDLVVRVPTHEEKEVELPQGEAISFSTTHADGVRTFSTRVLRHEEGREFPELVLTWPTGVVKVNRRDNVRMNTQIPVDIAYSLEENGKTQHVRGSTTDLSEGGLRLVVPKLVPAGTELSIHLHLPVAGTFVCGGRVVRTGTQERRDAEEVAGGAEGERTAEAAGLETAAGAGRSGREEAGEAGQEEGEMWLGVEFTNLSSVIQRSLRDYLWDLQREILRRAVR